ncbi:respiratory-chain NADH dehydrogenase, subunit [Clostridiales bacterium oral taxon 876 str. F0540]|nr:respiratory-chain NADH dehydrogenase, subunit [Clostridiales bacterium oral taxon 876 str. F0540]
MLDNLILVDKDNIREAVNNKKLYGHRFVAVTCEKEGEDYELTYHFDLNYEMSHIRILIKSEDVIKSVSSIYPSALLIENEYKDLYGFNFEGLLIDYKGHLMLSDKAPDTPMLAKKDNKEA